MHNTSKRTGDSPPSVMEAWERLAFPLFLFSVILFVFLVLSWLFVLPYLSQVHVGGDRIRIGELQSYHRDLTERLRQAEETRDRLVLPIADSVYKDLRSEKLKKQSALQIMEDIPHIAARIVPDIDDAVHIERMHLMVGENVLSIRGRVQNVGPRSMTILAQFLDALSDSSMIASLHHPVFTREEDQGGFFSPFVIRADLVPLTVQ